VAPVPVPAPTMFLLAVSPDGPTLLAADEVGQTAFNGPLWDCKIAFGSGPSDPNGAIHILDVRTNQISTLPDSKGLFSSRWSPDGRHIVAMPFRSRSLMLFGIATQKWDEIAKITCGFPNWSKNSDYVYFLHEENNPAVMRIRIRDRKVERVADLKHFRQALLTGKPPNSHSLPRPFQRKQ
jgi:Tol biopolymer transport system component